MGEKGHLDGVPGMVCDRTMVTAVWSGHRRLGPGDEARARGGPTVCRARAHRSSRRSAGLVLGSTASARTLPPWACGVRRWRREMELRYERRAATSLHSPCRSRRTAFLERRRT